MANPGWKCKFCRIMCRASPNFCQSCGTTWQQAWDRGGAWPTYTQEQQAPQTPRRPKSPRQRGKGKAKEGGAAASSSGKGKSRQEDVPTAPQLTQLPAPPTATGCQRGAEGDGSPLGAVGQVGRPAGLHPTAGRSGDQSHGTAGGEGYAPLSRSESGSGGEPGPDSPRAEYLRGGLGELYPDLVDTIAEQLKQREDTLASYDKSEEDWKLRLGEASRNLKEATGAGSGSSREMDIDGDEDSEAAVDADAAEDARTEVKREQTETMATQLLESLKATQKSRKEGGFTLPTTQGGDIGGRGPGKGREGCQAYQGAGQARRSRQRQKRWPIAFCLGPWSSLRGPHGPSVPLWDVAQHSVRGEADYVQPEHARLLATALEAEVCHPCLVGVWKDPRLRDGVEDFPVYEAGAEQVNMQMGCSGCTCVSNRRVILPRLRVCWGDQQEMHRIANGWIRVLRTVAQECPVVSQPDTGPFPCRPARPGS